jgi:hypothetical protein
MDEAPKPPTTLRRRVDAWLNRWMLPFCGVAIAALLVAWRVTGNRGFFIATGAFIGAAIGRLIRGRLVRPGSGQSSG